MPTVTEAINHGRRLIFQQEPTIVGQLLDAYESVWFLAERHILRYEGQIQAAVDAGEPVTEAWLRRQVWYRQMQASIDAEFVRFNRTALTTIIHGQADAVTIAGQSAELFRQAVGLGGSLQGRVNPGAMERWISAIQPNSPIRSVIAKRGIDAEQLIIRELTSGIGSGENATAIVRNITKAAGPDAQLGRIHTLARTETLRAYRGASRDSLTSIGQTLPGTHEWEWLATLSSRTCPSCIAYHRRRFPFGQYPDRFHPACRCTIILRVDRRLVSDRGRSPETGEGWFARQSESDQRAILPTNAHFELYQQGVPLSDMVTIRRSRTWGDSLRVKSAREIGA